MKRKKDNTVNINNNNGISITDSISLTFNSKYWINSKILLVITALAGVIGFTFSFLTLFNFPCNRQMIYIAEAMVFIVSTVIFMFPSKAKLLLAVIYILFGYGIYRTRIEFSNGYAEFINIIAAKIQITQPGHPYYKLIESVDPEHCLTLFLMFLFMIVTTIISYNTIVKPRFITVFSCTFPFIETGLMFGFSPDHTAFSLLIAYWVSVFAMRVAGNQYHSTSGKPVFVRKKNIFVSSGNLRNNVIEDIGIITLVSVFAVFIISAGIIDLLKSPRPESVKNTRTTIKTAISEFSIEKIANNINEDLNKSPVTEKSQLGNIPKITFANKTDLVVFVTDKIESTLYLKGFVGSSYQNNSWYALSNQKVQENSDLFKSFETSGYYPQYYNYINDSEMLSSNPQKIRHAHMIVNSMFKENRYGFTPYSVDVSDILKPEKDAFFRVGNLNSYSFDMFLTPDYYKDMSMIDKNSGFFYGISEYEKNYRDYVYQNYLLLPQTEQMEYLANEYAYIPDYNGSNIADIYKAIKTALKECEYTLEPGRTPSNMELTYYLLTKNRKGYCSHFATAAVVLARLSGVPARYAEGYVVIPSDMEKAEYTNSFYKLEVHDSRAHAWAEFYIDGYGWLPFEFTPGYDRGIVSAETDYKSEALQTTIEEVPVSEETTVVTVPVTESESLQEEETTEAVTEAPEVTSAPSADGSVTSLVSGNDPSSPAHHEHKPSKLAAVLILISRIIIGLILFFLLIFGIIMTQHILCLRKRIMSFRCKSNNISVSNVYNYTVELLSHTGINRGNMLPLEFAEYAEEKAKEKQLCEEGKIEELMHITLKASFSNEEVTSEELKQAVKTSYNIADAIYRSKNRRDRIIFKYFMNLCK